VQQQHLQLLMVQLLILYQAAGERFPSWQDKVHVP
jgi:hypothetical protein